LPAANKVKGIAHGIHGKRAEKGQKVKGKKTKKGLKRKNKNIF